MPRRRRCSADVIDARELRKTYALDGETPVAGAPRRLARVGAGELVAIMGASGSGKSTLLNLLGCLDRPTRGALPARRRRRRRARRRRARRAPQREDRLRLPELQPAGAHDRASRTSSCRSSTATCRRREHRARADAALAAVGLAERSPTACRPSSPAGSSSASRSRARSSTEPRLILADEPTGNLDTRTSPRSWRSSRELNREQRLTIVIVTHEPDVARARPTA